MFLPVARLLEAALTPCLNQVPVTPRIKPNTIANGTDSKEKSRLPTI